MTKQRARKLAQEKGHTLGNFRAEYHTWGLPLGQRSGKMWDVAWCTKCGDVCFANKEVSGGINPAVQNKCEGEGANDFARNS